MSQDLLTRHITDRHPIDQKTFIDSSRRTLDTTGALVLEDFFTSQCVTTILEHSTAAEDLAFFASSSHNVYLTPTDSSLRPDHAFNRQIVSSKGCIAHDQVVATSPLRDIYDSRQFRELLADVLATQSVHPYADELSGINVHFHRPGQELGWHFDNSSFAVTMLVRASDRGGRFEYIPDLRRPHDQEEEFARLRDALDGKTASRTLCFGPGALVMFRGRDALHRITPTLGHTTRVLAVFAYNTQEGIKLSDSAKRTFYGRLD